MMKNAVILLLGRVWCGCGVGKHDLNFLCFQEEKWFPHVKSQDSKYMFKDNKSVSLPFKKQHVPDTVLELVKSCIY